MDFPHLRRDTQFPYLNQVDVYSFQNTFDYTRWNKHTKIRLVNVIWNSDYADVVKFDTNAARDAWFDSIDDYFVVELESEYRIVPEGYVKLPIPYDVMARYNYLYVEMPIATSEEHPIDFETTEGIRRWYFFIDSLTYRAPNTTEVRVVPDVWTNFQNDVKINYMMLERGHAPVAFSDVDEYLSNPIENNEYLLAPDVNYGSSTIVRDSDYIPFGNGEKYLVMVSTIPPSSVESIGKVTGATSDEWQRPTYYNIDARYGYQLGVNGFTFGDAGDYSSLQTPVGNGSNDRLPNNVYAYAIKAEQCFGSGTFLKTLVRDNPNFVNSLVASFVVSGDMLNLGDSFTLAGSKVYSCIGSEKTIKKIELSKEMFSFPERYQRFAKLYTFPYASIELTDNDGKKVDVRIENTGDMDCRMVSSVAFPFINLRVFFTGINGVGSSSYEWRRIDGTTVNKSMFDGDWYESCFDWQVPTYALYMDGKTVYNLRNYNALQNMRRDALVGYHTSVRDANTAMQNGIDLAETAEDNVNASAATMVADMANTINAQTANTAAAVACATANTNSANDCGTQLVAQNNYQIDEDRKSTNTLMVATTVAENKVSIATAGNTAGASENSGAVSGGLGLLGMGVTAGAAVGGPLGVAAGAGITSLGMLIGAGVAQVTGSANMSNAMALTQCDSYVTQQTQERNEAVAGHATSANSTKQVSMNSDRTNQTNNNNSCITTQTANTTNCERINTNNDAATMNANAARTRGTSVANSGYTRQVSVLNAKEVLENAYEKAKGRYNDARNASPESFGTYTGSMAPDYMETRGIQIKVRTQSDGAIRQAGDMFARYGYALNQMWDVRESGLKLMKHFTYWKASDIWVDDRQSSNNAVNRSIEAMFMKGVTVWNNPDEIGRVNIYAN